jgi:hypothetical protein
MCFDAFPFPNPTSEQREDVGRVAGQIHAHREQALERDQRVTITAIYNVVEKLKSGEPLTVPERTVHEIAACGVLRDLHTELDYSVAQAYGWTWPQEDEELLARLVALHDDRSAEEAAGIVRWLRPDFQVPRFGEGVLTFELAEAAETVAPAKAPNGQVPWPRTAAEQIRMLQELLAAQPLTAEGAAARFRGPRVDHIARHLETLVLIGEARVEVGGVYHVVAEPG